MTTNDELRELLAKATPGPWRVNGGHAVAMCPLNAAECWGSQSATNAALIVAAVNALPDLLARLDSLAGEASKWKDEHAFQAALTMELLPYQERAITAEAELHKTRCERDEARACIETSAETIISLRAELARLAAATERATLDAGVDSFCGMKIVHDPSVPEGMVELRASPPAPAGDAVAGLVQKWRDDAKRPPDAGLTVADAFNACADDLFAALNAAALQSSGRDGMVRVPREPTDDMIRAGLGEIQQQAKYGNFACSTVYRAMLAAAQPGETK
jgi:hypothetical protein